MISLLQFLLMLVGAIIASGLLVALWGAMLLAAWDDLVEVVRHTIQSRRDTKLFHQVEEFRNDFS